MVKELYKEEKNDQVPWDLENALNGFHNQHNGDASHEKNTDHNLLTCVNNNLNDGLINKKITRERKVNSPRADIGNILTVSNNDLAKLDETKEQPSMIVLSNRLPFVLKRNERGGLIRKAR